MFMDIVLWFFAYLKLSWRLSTTCIDYRMGLAVSGNPIEFKK